MGSEHSRPWRLGRGRRRPNRGPAEPPGSEGRRAGQRFPLSSRAPRAPAIGVVERGLLQAEEKYLIEPGATLGTWFARVEETISVAARVTVLRIEEGRTLEGMGVVAEQRGLLADICAEAIRAAAVIWPAGPSPQVRAEILNLVSESAAERPVAGFVDVLVALARCAAALEPLANGLREVDLPMGGPTDGATVGGCFLDLATEAFGCVHVMC